MKIKCKQCYKKFKVDNLENISCEESTCEIKYKMSGTLLNFEGFPIKKSEIIDKFATPEPKSSTDFSEKEWSALMANSNSDPQTPYF